MINMVFACNGRLIPYVDVVAVKAMYGTEIIGKTILGTFSNVDSEDMVMNFLSNVELFHTKMLLKFVNFLIIILNFFIVIISINNNKSYIYVCLFVILFIIIMGNNVLT